MEHGVSEMTLADRMKASPDAVTMILDSLLPIERRVVELRAGLTERGACDLQATATLLELTIAATIRLENRCLAKLAKSGRLAVLSEARLP